MDAPEVVFRIFQMLLRTVIVIAVPLLIAAQPWPFSFRLLCILLFIYLTIVVSIRSFLQGEILRTAEKILAYTRLTFITVHIRNERDELTPAYERLKEDLEEERATKRWRYIASGGATIPATFSIITLLVYAALAVAIGYALAYPAVVDRAIDWAQALIGSWVASLGLLLKS